MATASPCRSNLERVLASIHPSGIVYDVPQIEESWRIWLFVYGCCSSRIAKGVSLDQSALERVAEQIPIPLEAVVLYTWPHNGQFYKLKDRSISKVSA